MRSRLSQLFCWTAVINIALPISPTPAVARETPGSFDQENDGQTERDSRDERDEAAEQAERDAEDERDAAEQAEKDAADASEDAQDSPEQAEKDAPDASEDAQDSPEQAEKDAPDAGEDAQDSPEQTEKDAPDAGEDAQDSPEQTEKDAPDAGEDAQDSPEQAEKDAPDAGDAHEETVADAEQDDDDTADNGVSEDGAAAVATSTKREADDGTEADSRGGEITPLVTAGTTGPTATSAEADTRAQADNDLETEYDREGYGHVAREIIALIPAGDDVSILRELGLSIESREDLSGLGMQLLRISLADGIGADDAVARLSIGDSDATFAVNHFYAAGRLGGRAATERQPRKRAPMDVTVGMIDGGVANGVFDPEVKIERRGYSPKGRGSDHGTAVASILVQSGATRIVVADIFSGSSAQAASIVRALDWMATLRIGVINMSFAGPPNPVIAQMINLMERRGHMIVAAIGNDGPAAPPLYPAAYAGVVAVTAVDRQGKIYRRANRGAWTSFAAQGVDVTTTDASGTDRLVSGTSFAAPVVSALLARELPTPSPDARKRALERLIASARDLGTSGRDPVYGYGLVGIDR